MQPIQPAHKGHHEAAHQLPANPKTPGGPQPFRWLTLVFSTLTLALLAAMWSHAAPIQATSLAQRETTISNFQADKSFEPGDSPVLVGEVITYVLRMQHTGDRPRDFSLSEDIPWPLRLAGSPQIQTIEGQINSTRVGVRYERLEDGRTNTQIGWRGRMDANTTVELTIPVEVSVVCRPGQTERTLTSRTLVRALNAQGETVASQTIEGSYGVSCPQAATLDDVQLSWSILIEDAIDGAPFSLFNNENINGPFEFRNFLLVRASFTNNNAQQSVVIGYRVTHEYIGETEKNLDPRDGHFTPLLLAPGESRTVEVWTDMRPLSRQMTKADVISEAFVPTAERLGGEFVAQFGVHHLLLPAVQLRSTQVIPDADAPIRSAVRDVHMRGWDMGDAPDSSNHFETPMTAYPGVQASFPTVYNPETNPTQIGPAHQWPREFHLGRSVSLEADADLDISPNIAPSLNQADGDLHDDGVNPSAWELVHCQATTIEARIFVSERAAAWFSRHAQPGYLNGWIDSNRNGRWGDTHNCSGTPTYEHFIIDHAIDVAALGPGYHTLAVPTGLIFWPDQHAQAPAWVRITLSEQPSVKAGPSSPNGDGRGPARPFLFGETEDYLLIPRGTSGSGPDLEVTVSGSAAATLVPSQGTAPAWHAGIAAADFTFQKIEFSVVGHIANRGTAASGPSQLVWEFPPDLLLPIEDLDFTLSIVVQSGEMLRQGDAVDYSIDGNTLTVPLEPLAPGQSARVMLRFGTARHLVEALGSEIIVYAQANTAGDLNPSRNRAEFKFDPNTGRLTGEALAFSSPESPFWVREGTTSSSTLQFRGMLPTGETAMFIRADGTLYQDRLANKGYVNVWIHGLPNVVAQPEYLAPGVYVEEVSFRANGNWDFELRDLPDGFYQIAVGHPSACDARMATLAGNDNEWRYIPSRLIGIGIVCGLAVVDSTLPLDPITLGFVEVPADAAQAVVAPGPDGKPRVEGRVFLPDTLRWGQGEWSVRLPGSRPGTGYSVILGQYPTGNFVPVEAIEFVDTSGGDVLAVAAVETAIPALYATPPFFFDEADALFGKQGGAMSRDMVMKGLDKQFRLRSTNTELVFGGRTEGAALGQVWKAPAGVEVSAVSGATVAQNGLEPVQATIFVMQSLDGRTFVPWDGEPYGQANPVTTDAQGRYSLTLPRGQYQLWAMAEGYETYRSRIFQGNGPVSLTIGLRPAAGETPKHILILDQDYVEPAVTIVAPGELIQFISMDETPRLLEARGDIGNNVVDALEPLLGRAQTDINTGESIVRSSQLHLGDGFTIRAGESGSIVVEDPSGAGTPALLLIRQADDPNGPGDPNGPDDPDEPGDPNEPGDPDHPHDPNGPGEGAGPTIFLPQLQR